MPITPDRISIGYDGEFLITIPWLKKLRVATQHQKGTTMSTFHFDPLSLVDMQIKAGDVVYTFDSFFAAIGQKNNLPVEEIRLVLKSTR